MLLTKTVKTNINSDGKITNDIKENNTSAVTLVIII